MTEQQLHAFGLSPKETEGLVPVEYQLLTWWSRMRFLRATHNTAESVPAKLLVVVIKDNDYDSMRYLEGLGCSFDERHTALAAACGNTRALRRMLSQGVACEGTPTGWGAGKCALRRWMQIMVDSDWHACGLAAKHGMLQSLKVLHKYKCPWDAITTYEAAYGGHLACLQYAVENGCECTQEAMDIAIAFNRSDCVTYMETLGLRTHTRRLRSGRVC